MEHLEAAIEALTAAAGSVDVEGRLALLARAREEVEAAIIDAVAEARVTDRSWARIGKCFGVTRQAAQSRYADLLKPLAEPEQAEPIRPARTPRERTEMVALATARGLPLLRLRVERMPIPVARRSS